MVQGGEEDESLLLGTSARRGQADRGRSSPGIGATEGQQQVSGLFGRLFSRQGAATARKRTGARGEAGDGHAQDVTKKMSHGGGKPAAAATTTLMRQRDMSYAKLLKKYGGGGGDVEDGFGDGGGGEDTSEDLTMHIRRARRRWPSRRLWLRVGADDGTPTTLAAARMHIIKDLGIPHRDLRFVDSTTATTTSAFIHAREKAIVFCIESLKMIIASDHVLILKEHVSGRATASPRGSRASMLDTFVQLLSSKLKQRLQDVEMSNLRAHAAQSTPSAAAARTETSSTPAGAPVRAPQFASNGHVNDGTTTTTAKAATTAPMPIPTFVLPNGSPRGRTSLAHLDASRKRGVSSSPDLKGLDGGGGDGDPPDADIMDSDDEAMLDFEFVVLDCALEVICAHYEKNALNLRVDLLPALDKLANTVNSVNLDDVKRLKSRASRLMQRVGKVRDELTRFLDDDSDMRQLYLSRKLAMLTPEYEASARIDVPSPRLVSRSPPSRQNSLDAALGAGGTPGAADRVGPGILHGGIAIDDDSDVLEAENLLEAYFMQIDTIANLLSVLDEHVDDTEDYINIELDFKRNELIQLELLLTTGTFSLGIYSVVAGIFGMNMTSLPNASFTVVIFATLFACALAFLAVLVYCWKRRLLFAR